MWLRRCSRATAAAAAAAGGGRRRLAVIAARGFQEPVRLREGDHVELTRSFSGEDVEAFAAVSGDSNAVHLSDEAAAQTRFKRRVAHGMLTGSLFSTLFGTTLPGCIYLGQRLRFRAPVFLDTPVTARVTVRRVNAAKRVVTCDTELLLEDGTLAIDGDATVLVPQLEVDNKGEQQQQ